MPPKRKQKADHSIALGSKWSDCSTPIDARILQVIQKEYGFKTMSPVQENSIPLLLQNKDIVAEACTGSGKTLAYLIPIFQIMLGKQTQIESHERDFIYSIVLCPTRELARQIFDQVALFVKHIPQFKAVLLTGGAAQEQQADDSAEFGTSHGWIAVCTPGRLLDTLTKQQDIAKHLEILILDEADRILDMGFEIQVDKILRKLPKQRRTGLFSATQTSEMKDMIRSGLRNPIKVQVQPTTHTQQATPKELTNYYMICNQEERLSQLIHYLKQHKHHKVIVYFITCACVNYFAKLLQALVKQLGIENDANTTMDSMEQDDENDEDEEEEEEANDKQNKTRQNSFTIYALHGKMVQKRRTATYQEFSAAKRGVLVCTDVAARGLDFPDVHTIVQYDAPQDPAVFIHRVGRTARMGKTGTSLLFLSEHEEDYVEYLKVKQVPIQEMTYDTTASNVLAPCKQLLMQDLDLVEKSQDAFISFLRAYKEHQCNYIFKFKDLQLNALAKGYALLAKPKLWKKEFKTLPLELEAEVDISKIPYKDARREKARQERQKKPKEEVTATTKNAAKKTSKEEKQLGSLYDRKNHVRERNDMTSRKRKREYEDLEYDELAYEHKLLKKLKQKKITLDEYEELTGEKALLQSYGVK